MNRQSGHYDRLIVYVLLSAVEPGFILRGAGRQELYLGGAGSIFFVAIILLSSCVLYDYIIQKILIGIYDKNFI